MSDATAPTGGEPIRVVVIDDSAFNRQTISSMLESQGMKVVGRAADGDEGLKLVFQTQPDIVTLDLEMPRMDGFTFLRILMIKRPTPVIVISGQGSKENVFKALELGALDFVVKPPNPISANLMSIRDELIAKLRLVKMLRPVLLEKRARAAATRVTAPHMAISLEPPQPPPKTGPAPARLVLIGASTGGPPAILQLLQAISPQLVAGVLITQHMPPKFTRAFADRLARLTRLPVREAEEGDPVIAGQVLVAPGSGTMLLRRDGPLLRVTIDDKATDSGFIPSIDRMFESAGSVMGPDCLGLILTGMGGDVSRGVRALKKAGGRVIVENPDEAVIAGMPNEAIHTGVVDEVLSMAQLAQAIDRFGLVVP